MFDLVSVLVSYVINFTYIHAEQFEFLAIAVVTVQ